MSKFEAGFIIACSQPQKLAEFYALVLKAQVTRGFSNNHYLIFYKNLWKIQFYSPSRDKALLNRGPSAIAVCFEKEPSTDPFSEVVSWSNDIEGIGGTIVDGPFNEKFGAEAWISDPEGNNFLIVVPLDQSISS